MEKMNSLFGKRKINLWIFIFFLCVALFLTWPLLPNFFRSIYGEVGDPVNAVWSFKWFRETALSGHSGALNYPYAGYPEGIEGYLPLPFIYMPLTLVTYLPRGEAIVYNLIILISLTLNGFMMFLLGKKLFKNLYAALGMGLIYMFCPYALARARFHFTLVEIFVFPLVLYVLLNLKENFNRRNKIVFALVLLLSLNIHPYYTCMVLFMLALLFLYYVMRRLRRGDLKNSYRMIWECFLLTLAASIMAGVLLYIQLIWTSGGLSSISRQEGDLYSYAARTWNYFLPSSHSTFLGGITQQFLPGKVYSVKIEEYILFLGYMNMGLALVGLVFWFLRRHSKLANEVTENVRRNCEWLIAFALLLGATSFLFSLQPIIRIGGLTVHMPSWFVYRIFPFIRVYARFGVLVFFAVTLISGACLSFLAESLKARGRLIGLAVFVLVLALVLSEFVEMGNRPLRELYKPEVVYTEVRDLPDDVVIAEYPFVATDESYNSVFLWNHFYHGKSMLNGYSLKTEGEALRLQVLNLLDPRTPGLLAYMGADYVTVHEDMYRMGSEYSYSPSGVDLSALPTGLKIVEEGDDSALLKVESQRPDTVVLYDPKCGLAYQPGMNPGLWLQSGKEWTMKIDASEAMIVDIEFDIYSVRGDRDLNLDLGSGREMIEMVGNAMERITLSEVQLEKGINSVYLSTTAEEVPCNRVFGGNDLRPVSFIMSFWEVKNTIGDLGFRGTIGNGGRDYVYALKQPSIGVIYVSEEPFK